MAAERLHADDTTVPLLAKGRTKTARLWTMPATTGRSPDRRRRQRSSASPPTERASTRGGI